jgi:GT2 family glycosyltransferase
MKLSVVIPCYNEATTIGTQLEALADQDFEGSWEVVVSDNGSTDGSVRVVEGFRGRIPEIRVVDSSDARGAAHARNVGIRAAFGEGILLCDADDVVAENYLTVMSSALERHEFIACRFETEVVNEPWQTESWPNGQASSLLGSTGPFLPFAGAGSLGFRRAVFDRVGGFDPAFRAREDQDFCWRVQLLGVPLHFVPETAIHYRYPARLRAMYRQSRSLGEYSVLIYRKYRPLGHPSLPWRKALRGKVRWIRLLKQLRRLPTADRAQRARFVRDMGHKVGRLRGSIRYRQLAL